MTFVEMNLKYMNLYGEARYLRSDISLFYTSYSMVWIRLLIILQIALRDIQKNANAKFIVI